MKYFYEYDMQCDHYGKSGYSCIEDEYCELGYLLPDDLNTIDAGFNLYMALQILVKRNPGRSELECVQRDDNEYLYLMQNETEFLLNIAYQHQRSSEHEKINFNMWSKL